MRALPLCIPTLRCYDLLIKTIQSALEGSYRPTHIHVIDNGARLPSLSLDRLRRMCHDAGVELLVQMPGENKGVAASWNWFLQHWFWHADGVVIANDDIIIHHESLARFAQALDDRPDTLLFYSEAGDVDGRENAWSFYCQRPISLTTVGGYDEGIIRSYTEDNDYNWRLRLWGMPPEPVKGVAFDHIGSATLKRSTAQEEADHWIIYQYNWNRYQAKWGGIPGKEVYQTPWNGEGIPDGFLFRDEQELLRARRQTYA